jgi:predicted permease
MPQRRFASIRQLLEGLVHDSRFGLRAMRRHPQFASLAILSLALGIGASAAVYSFADALLFRALPVADPGSLVSIRWHSRPFNFRSATPNVPSFVVHEIDGNIYQEAAATTAGIFPVPAFERLSSPLPAGLSSLFGFYGGRTMNVQVAGDADIAATSYVTGGFFSGLELTPAAGRLLGPADDRVGAAPVIVVSTRYAERRLGGVNAAVNQIVTIDRVAFTVAGVAPTTFMGVDASAPTDVYLPVHARALLDPEAGRAFGGDNYYWLQVMGRLRPGADAAQVQAALAARFAAWVTPTAANDVERANLPVLHLEPGAGGSDTLRRRFAKPVYVLLAMVVLLQAIACANIANLLLARAAARRREMAVRLGVGASRSRLVRQLLTESVLLAAIGGALGVAVAASGIGLLTRLLANDPNAAVIDARINGHVLLAIAVASLLSGLLFGLAPIAQALRGTFMAGLKDGTSDLQLSRSRPRITLTRALVTAQMATSVLLLAGAGVFVRTVTNLNSVPLGFTANDVVLFDLNAPRAGLADAQAAAFYDEVQQSLAQAPGVRAVSLSHASLIRAGRSVPISVGGQFATGARVLQVGDGFFTTMGIPLREGHEADHAGSQSARGVVVSEQFVRTFLGGRSPIGRPLHIGGRAPQDFEIVGVAAEAHYGSPRQQTPPVVYLPYAAIAFPPLSQMTFAVRTSTDPLSQLSTIRDIVRQTNPRVPVTRLRSLRSEIDASINQELLFARLCSVFAMLALIIACVGLYGTMAYGVARRTREIAIRMALGAQRRRVVWMVLGEACILAIVGIAISLPAIAAGARAIEAYVFDVRPADPSTIALAAATLMAAATLASYRPAMRAARIDPNAALRSE